ncbi:MAG: hypothetical protein ACE37K_12855 [Planctomycetota bacterium]|jgi:hypothetical protein
MKNDDPRRCFARDLALMLLGATLAIVALGAVLAGGCCMLPGIGPI